MSMQKHPRKLCKAFWGFRLKPIQVYQKGNKKSIEEYIQVNDNEFEDIRNEEIELRALELLSQFLDKYFS